MIRHLRLNEMDLQRCKQMLTFLERHSDRPLCIFGNGRTTALGWSDRMGSLAFMILTGLVKSAVNQIMDKRFDKRQSMRWTPHGAHLLLQTRTRVIDGDLDQLIRRRYPTFRPLTVGASAPALGRLGPGNERRDDTANQPDPCEVAPREGGRHRRRVPAHERDIQVLEQEELQVSAAPAGAARRQTINGPTRLSLIASAGLVTGGRIILECECFAENLWSKTRHACD